MTIEVKDLGRHIDDLYKAREERLSLERKAKELKEVEGRIKTEILDCLAVSGLRKATGEVATAGMKVSTVPMSTDWDLTFAYIKENDRFDLVQKRLSVLAWRETLDNGILVPGTEPVEAFDLALTKSSRG